jgi:hypothetical protein
LVFLRGAKFLIVRENYQQHPVLPVDIGTRTNPLCRIPPFTSSLSHTFIFILSPHLCLVQSTKHKLKNKTMKKTKILYWIFTGIFSFFMLGSAIPDIFSADLAVEGFAKMGLPAYLVPFVGVAKALGVVAILIPGFPKIKEWAYAGLMFDLIGAIYSMAAAGIPAGDWMPVFIPVAFGVLSYVFYHRKMKVVSSENVRLQAA